MKCTVTLVLFLLTNLVHADNPKPPTTFPAHGDTLVVTGVVHAPVEDLWNSFTTAEGLVKVIGVAKAKLDFRVGGSWRAVYDATTDLDSDKAIVNTILAYEPRKFLVIKPTAPAGSPDWLKAICRDGWNVIRFESLSPQATRITIVGMGFQQNPLHDQAYAFFKAGNEWTIKNMQEKFGANDSTERNNKTMALIKSCVGGEWVADQKLPDGKTMRGRAVWTEELGGKFVRGTGSLGDETGIHPHAIILVGINPQTEATAFWNYGEAGDVSHGHFTLIADDVLAMDWHSPTAANPEHAYYMEMRFLDKDHYDFVIFQSPASHAAGDKPLISVHYKRVRD